MTAPRHQSRIWHNLYVDGAPYPTRHHHADFGGAIAYGEHHLGLPADDIQQIRAIHEAAHAVVAIAGGGHLHHAQIEAPDNSGDTGGVCGVCGLADSQLLATYCAAGERADDRWLREQGLWNDRRAVCVEVGARGDRQILLASNPRIGFGDKEVDYHLVHDLADQAIDQHWTRITTVAEVLVKEIRMDGDEIANLIRIPNGSCWVAT
ncbi:hypothetical protein ABZ379_45780 [Streptomyces canus]|uniref:hypothetical protein n=1 Tax=Streptomyces canus TaxID=58343 RepID=UPI0033D6A25E